MALGWRRRLIGLLGRSRLGPQEGLLLPACRSIHTWFMRLPIDVLILDRQGRVLRCLPDLGPWRLIWPHRAAWGCLELSPGAMARAGVRVGDQLLLEA